MHILGNTLGEIAYEKRRELLSLVFRLLLVWQDEEALQSFKKLQRKIMQMYTRWATIFTSLHKQSSEDGEHFDFTCPFASFEDVRISMKGSHQVGNAALALMAVMYVKTYLSFFN